MIFYVKNKILLKIRVIILLQSSEKIQIASEIKQTFLLFVSGIKFLKKNFNKIRGVKFFNKIGFKKVK